MVNRFLQGTLILTIAGFVVKAIGSINWIFAVPCTRRWRDWDLPNGVPDLSLIIATVQCRDSDCNFNFDGGKTGPLRLSRRPEGFQTVILPSLCYGPAIQHPDVVRCRLAHIFRLHHRWSSVFGITCLSSGHLLRNTYFVLPRLLTRLANDDADCREPNHWTITPRSCYARSCVYAPSLRSRSRRRRCQHGGRYRCVWCPSGAHVLLL